MRVLRREEWQGFEAALSATVKHVREDAKSRGLLDLVDEKLLRACESGQAEAKQPAKQPVATH
jgi:hypothetical protein